MIRPRRPVQRLRVGCARAPERDRGRRLRRGRRVRQPAPQPLRHRAARRDRRRLRTDRRRSHRPGDRALLDGPALLAGADFGDGEEIAVASVYEAAYRLFKAQTPVVAAVQGAAVGGGLGLAMSADFRIATETTRFQANFARLGLHHGFGLTVSLPRVVGHQTAAELMLGCAPVKGQEALAIGLCDGLASNEPADDLRTKARDFAAEITAGGPLAVRSIRATLRGDLAERIREATAHEAAEQARLFATNDFKEGVQATAERRPPKFTGTELWLGGPPQADLRAKVHDRQGPPIRVRSGRSCRGRCGGGRRRIRRLWAPCRAPGPRQRTPAGRRDRPSRSRSPRCRRRPR